MEFIRDSAGETTSSLDPNAFSFVGFGPLPREELRRISRLSIRTGHCDVTSVENALLHPGSETREDRSDRHLGGVYDSAGIPVAAAGIQRKGGKQFGPIAAVSGTDVPSVDEDVVYLGPLFNHYGRVLLETLARAWYINEPEAIKQRVVVSVTNSAQGEIASWIPALLEAFGVSSQRLLPTDVVTRFRRIAVPEPLFEQSHAAHVRMVEPFHRVARGDDLPASTTNQPLYLSRQGLTSRQRPIIGEAEVERILRENGALVVYPEKLSLAMQVRLFNTHCEILSPVGSAAHTILFATNRPRLHLLASRDDIPANYFLCSALADAPTNFVNCVISAGEESDDEEATQVSERRGSRGRGADPFAGLQSRPQRIEIEPFVEYLRNTGFLRQQYRPLTQADSVRLDARFDEAWAYSRLRKAAGKSSALGTDIEKGISQLSTTSWPISLMMARYFSRLGDVPRAEEMSRQFLELIIFEADEARLRHFQEDAIGIVQRLKRQVGPDLRLQLAESIDAHWPLRPSEDIENA